MGIGTAAAIGIGGSVAGGLLGSRESSQEKGLESQEASNAAQGSQLASSLTGPSTQALGSAQNFWQSVVNGNQANTAQQLAGTINPIQSASRAAETSALEFPARGGGQTLVEAQIPYQRQNAVTSAVTNLAAQAPNELAQIGATEGSLATQALGQSTVSASSALSFLQSQTQQGIQVGNSVGSALGNLLYYYLNGTQASGGGGGGGGSDIPIAG